MNGHRTEELVIVGGGLAGASAACILGREGRSVLLLERDVGARHKVCGEFLSVEAQTYLARLGIDLDALGASRISHLRLYHRGKKAEAELPFLARGLSRKILDEALLEKAISHGAQIMRGVTVRSITADERASWVDAGSLGRVRAETLFLASGKHDVRGAKRPISGSINDLIGFKMHYRLSEQQRTALDGAIEVILFDEGYAGLQLIEGGVANLCLVVSQRGFEQAGKSWDSLVNQVTRECPPVADRLRNAIALFERPFSIFQIPYGFVHHPDWTEPGGLFRLGDQMGVIPSFTGEGMSMALHSGYIAASMFLRNGRASTDFHRKMAANVRQQIRLAFLLNKAARFGPGQAVLFHLCRTWPSLMRQVAAFTRIRVGSIHKTAALS
ncbi:NAD(P)/FAD-dependent oxidoreductase [Microvirga terrestris]|uniref:FAD-dependent monooxygenase n=1 Tax=Microvirga terrestris TaxID=2791024 RepID=A0ABS0HVQ1_9HYPH|nr:FAD-dependent monooxygenase [Microvirga terrestris]MBF9197580.1 FAD-dependent monooxygenase [Microvirga terrestris]